MTAGAAGKPAAPAVFGAGQKGGSFLPRRCFSVIMISTICSGNGCFPAWRMCRETSENWIPLRVLRWKKTCRCKGICTIRKAAGSSGGSGEMKPRNPQQYCALNLLLDEEVPVKLLTGRFGTGKTMACVIAALQAVEEGKFEKIVFVRNNVQVKDTENLGALPGEIDNKMLPYLLPFADHCGGLEGIKRLVDDGKLEVIPLAYLRGRSIRNAIIYSMESENLTKEHIQLIIGRVDEGSQVWFDGDLKQRDKGVFEKSQGLEIMIERLQGNPLFGYIHMPKVERSEVAALADELDD